MARKIKIKVEKTWKVGWMEGGKFKVAAIAGSAAQAKRYAKEMEKELRPRKK